MLKIYISAESLFSNRRPSPLVQHVLGSDRPANGYVGIEIYGYSPDINRGRGYSVQLWDMLLESGRRVWGFAVDDCHYGQERPNCCGGWIVAAANALTQVAVLEAIRRSAFYSSQGPSFYDIITAGEGLHVRCSPVKVIRFISQTPGAGWSFHARTGEHLREMFVRWDGQRPRLGPNYVRVEIVDDAGRIAWSNPIYLSDIGNDKDIEAQCDAIRAQGRVVVFMGDRLNRVAQLKPAMYLRGIENIFIDLAVQKEIAHAILRKVKEFYLAYLERILEAAKGKVDIVLTGDDFGSQSSLLISPRTWRTFIKPGFAEYISLIKSYDVKSMHHTCGSVVEIIPELIE